MKLKENEIVINGRKMVALRKAKKLKMKTILNYVGCARSTYTAYELGYRNPSLKNLGKIAEILGTTTDDLLKPSDDESLKAFKNRLMELLNEMEEAGESVDLKKATDIMVAEGSMPPELQEKIKEIFIN
ncbi:helix-turn-helix domain-containing protein [Fictibacillus phosphorivorans]|uniref:helix-turn-helix domain-containing protein n=1 Tax=Fictibacillus phosphorivorans TaxID=1221500 RepID=UPI003CEB3643